MTIAVSWLRTVGDCEELVFVSDSRLSGDGRTFDASPKILLLPRGDCAIAFAGYTGHAFPMMLQLDLAIDSYGPSRRRSLDISSLKTHALKVFDGMADLIQSSAGSSVQQDVDPEASFLFGGYSWVKKEFELWSLTYVPSLHHFKASPAEWIRYTAPAKRFLFSKTNSPKGPGPFCKVVVAGDQASKFRTLVLDKLATKHPNGTTFTGLDWEPFEVVRDMLRDPNHSETIGGAPQVVKVYQYMQTVPLGVYWPDKKTGNVYLQGRPCLGYERTEMWIIDPDSLKSENPSYSSKKDDEFLDKAGNDEH